MYVGTALFYAAIALAADSLLTAVEPVLGSSTKTYRYLSLIIIAASE